MSTTTAKEAGQLFEETIFRNGLPNLHGQCNKRPDLAEIVADRVFKEIVQDGLLMVSEDVFSNVRYIIGFRPSAVGSGAIWNVGASHVYLIMQYTVYVKHC